MAVAAALDTVIIKQNNNFLSSSLEQTENEFFELLDICSFFTKVMISVRLDMNMVEIRKNGI